MFTRIVMLSIGLLVLAGCTPAKNDAVKNMMDDTEGTDEAMMDDKNENEMIKDDGVEEEDDAMMNDVDEKDDDKMMDDDKKDDAAMMIKAVYTTYDASILMNGKAKVLFFAAAWCGECRESDEDLQEWFGQGLPIVDVYKVDYDNSTDLKVKYGVTYQHTFVLVDGKGNALKTVQGPSDTALKALIGVPQS